MVAEKEVGLELGAVQTGQVVVVRLVTMVMERQAILLKFLMTKMMMMMMMMMMRVGQGFFLGMVAVAVDP